ncbi:hypothetical protein NU10_00975 [Flavobacterium dauae]|uniref:hypothetical protein n=1 Tax=Flavobacterium dauae TaxID=1563479 RepID=UPI00101B25E2|nr:hypothetical protein [Flavobacterium dauae]WLD23994.1 hypothetical protein NU10_00975 [Flavobacterium dauae]
MKKMTFIAALLGATYFANAQVGIGTPTPAEASMLHINADNKGVIIPNVELQSTSDVATIVGTEVESLLVYNTATAGNVTPGFYYWVPAQTSPVVAAHWERIVNQTQLDEAIKNITDVQADLAKVIALLKVAFPANNLVDPTVTGDTHGGGMVFTPGATPTIEYVYFDGTNYVKKDITADIIDLIKGNETKTKIVTINNVQYYVSESYTGTAAPTTGTEAGVYKIDVVGGIINNFEEFVTNNPVTVNGDTYTTVEEYIQYISENAMQDGVTKIVIDATTNQASFQRWDKTANTWVNVANAAFKTIVKANETVTTMTKNADGTYTYKNEAGADVIIDIPASVIQELGDIIEATTTFNNSTATTLVEYIQNMINNTDLPAGTVTAEIVNGNIVFSIIGANGVATVVPSTAFNNIVKANETKTTIGKSTNNSAYTQVTADPKAAQKIVYEYLTESATVKNYIDVTADVEWSIENNTNVKNAIEEIIKNLLNQGGNVYFTRTAIAAGTPAGQLAIPAFSFYTINATTGVKELVDIAQTIVNAITNATTVQKQEIKNQLGDKINKTTVVKTGDTFNGGDVYIYTNTTTIAANTAVTSGITIPTGTVPGTIIGIKVINANGISANVTDVVIAGQDIDFNIGTGNVYNILGAGTYDVIVEFTE